MNTTNDKDQKQQHTSHSKDTEDVRIAQALDNHTFEMNENDKEIVGRPKHARWPFAL